MENHQPVIVGFGRRKFGTTHRQKPCIRSDLLRNVQPIIRILENLRVSLNSVFFYLYGLIMTHAA